MHLELTDSHAVLDAPFTTCVALVHAQNLSESQFHHI